VLAGCCRVTWVAHTRFQGISGCAYTRHNNAHRILFSRACVVERPRRALHHACVRPAASGCVPRRSESCIWCVPHARTRSRNAGASIGRLLTPPRAGPPRRFDLEHRAMSDREVQSFLQMCYSFDIDCLVRGGADDSQQGSPCPEDSCIPLLEVTCPRHQVRSPSVAERTKLYRYLEVRAAASPHSRLTLVSPSPHYHRHRAAISHGHGPRCRRTWARVTIDRV
jgi:hypothetical protein